jgi:hypothetical protein
VYLKFKPREDCLRNIRPRKISYFTAYIVLDYYLLSQTYAENSKAETKAPRKRIGVPAKSDPKAKRVKKTLDKENLQAAKSEVNTYNVYLILFR